MERAAFARARTYLDYHPVAKWSSLAASVGSGILYVVLLVLLGLFTDLAVNRGEIPCYANLASREKDAFDVQIQIPAEPDEQKAFLKEIEHRLTALEISSEGATKLASTLSPDLLSPADQEIRKGLLWFLKLPQTLAEAVGPDAGEEVQSEIRHNLHQQYGLEVAVNRNLEDFGLLSLVVQTRNSFSGWFPAWLARWNSWTWFEGNLFYVQGLFLVAVGVAFLRAGLVFLGNYLAAVACGEAITRLRRAVYHHTYRLGTLAFKALGPSEAVGVSTRHLEAVHDGLLGWLTTYFREPVKFGLLLLFALLINFWLALAFLLFSLLVWMIGGQIAAYFRQQGRSAMVRAAEQLALLQESLMLMRLVKVYLMELFNQARVERQLATFASAQIRRFRGEAIYRPLLAFLGLLAVLVLLLVAGIIILHGQLGFTSALVMATALVSLYWPAVAWLEQRRYLRRARQSAEVVFKFLDKPGGVGQVVEAEFLPPMNRHLEFDNVTIQEPGTGRKLLQGVSFTLQARQKIAVVGPDDMEKHALVYLIPRFLDPNSGEIRIDRKNLRWVTLDSLRAQIAIVLQHNLVFNDTVANNIGCGDPSYKLPQVIEAAKTAHAHQFIQKLPQGYETPIGEMGHALKIGETFRIALARAILRDPALLIVEEPGTPLDDDTKDLLDDTFNRVLPGRTTIFLPHRLSTIRNCDRVLFLYNGKIEASGDHRELLAQSELYRHLQYLEFNEFAGLFNGPPPAPGRLEV